MVYLSASLLIPVKGLHMRSILGSLNTFIKVEANLNQTDRREHLFPIHLSYPKHSLIISLYQQQRWKGVSMSVMQEKWVPTPNWREEAIHLQVYANVWNSFQTAQLLPPMAGKRETCICTRFRFTGEHYETRRDKCFRTLREKVGTLPRRRAAEEHYAACMPTYP